MSIQCKPLGLALLVSLAYAGPASAQQTDFAKLVQAPGIMQLGEGAKVGFRAEIQIQTVTGTTMSYFTAIVGETQDHWEIESSQVTSGYASTPGGEGLVLALVVDKKSFEVISRLGLPGGALQDVEIKKFKAVPKAPEGKLEEFTLPSGKTVKARVTASQVAGKAQTTWVGAKGTKLEGVLFKSVGPKGLTKELSADPAKADYELKDVGADGKARSVAGRKVLYTDGTQHVLANDPVAKSITYGVLSVKFKGGELKVVSLTTKGSKTLNWN